MLDFSGDVERSLRSALARMLQLDAALSIEEALTRLERIVSDNGLPDAATRLAALGREPTRHAIVNPGWLHEEGLSPHFFLASGRPGFLEQLVRQSDETRAGVSHYVLYGEWDALILLLGTTAEAEDLHSRLSTGAYTDPTPFAAERVLLAYGHRVKTHTDVGRPLSADVVNTLALDFDAVGYEAQREELLASGHLLGATWRFANSATFPVVAFVGLSLHGRASVQPPQVVDALLSNELLKQCLVHVFQIRHGLPFHYFLKLCCLNMEELDEATNAIGYGGVGNVRFEGATLVVASGTDQLPMFRRADTAGLPLAPDLSSMVRAGERVFLELRQDEQEAFNRLDASRQIAVVRMLTHIRDRLATARLSDDMSARVDSALMTISHECTINVERPNLTGAVTEVSTAVEGNLKRLLSKLAYATYGNDPARIQRELRLPTRAIRNLSLGKIFQALKAAAAHEDFQGVSSYLDDSWLERIDRFAETRNRWAHDAATDGGAEVLDDAYSALLEGIEISDWVEAVLIQINDDTVHERASNAAESDDLTIELTSKQRQRDVFVSHASLDNEVAERVAMGLKAFGVRTWYAEWELRPGDSIVDRINAGLAGSDTLLVLLSANSVKSRWVQRELNTAVMAQLAGEDVTIIPVIVDDCDVPEVLRDIFYIDLRSDFESGLLSLLNALRTRQGR